jgi:hypothetical protein
MTLDPVLCADGCGRPADRERPYGMDRDGDEIVELVCERCASPADRAAAEWRAWTAAFAEGWDARAKLSLRSQLAYWLQRRRKR